MSITVNEDLVDGPSYRDGPNGIECTRVFIVEGVGGSSVGRQYLASKATKIPQKGAAHPVIAGIRVDTVDVQTLSPEQFKVICSYKNGVVTITPDEGQPAQISVGSSVQEVQTNKDIKGKLMLVSYEKATFDTEGNPTGTETKEQTGEVAKQVPQVVASFSRREKLPPLDKARTYVGRINRGNFLGDASGYWLCTRIYGDSSDGGKSYQVQYEFQRDESQWRATVAYIDPETNSVPTDVKEDVGIKTFDIYNDIDFNALRLSLVVGNR